MRVGDRQLTRTTDSCISISPFQKNKKKFLLFQCRRFLDSSISLPPPVHIPAPQIPWRGKKKKENHPSLYTSLRPPASSPLSWFNRVVVGRYVAAAPVFLGLRPPRAARNGPQAHFTTNCIVFLVPEMHKRRNRIIAWPILANAACEKTYSYSWQHDISRIADILEIIEDIKHSDDEFAATFDLKASYYQIPIADRDTPFVFQLLANNTVDRWVILLRLRSCMQSPPALLRRQRAIFPSSIAYTLTTSCFMHRASFIAPLPEEILAPIGVVYSIPGVDL